MRIQLTLAAAGCLAASLVHGQDRPTLTIDAIVSSAPSLAGTSPVAPAWSPDSRWVAFRWNSEARPGRDLWIVAGIGGRPRRLTQNGAGDFVWSRDSRTLFYSAGDGMWRVDLTGGEPRRLTTTGEQSDLTLSPDGQTLAFLSQGDLWLTTIATGRTSRTTRVAVTPPTTVRLGTYDKPEVEIGRYVWGGEMPPYAWSPDGRTIAIQIVDRRQVRQMPVPSYLGEETSQRLLRRGSPGDTNESRTIAFLDVATGTIRPLALADPTSVQNIGMEWSSRGALLIDRESDTAEDRWILIADPADATAREVWHDQRPTRIYNAVAATWHPDGSRVLFIGDLDDRYRLYALVPGSSVPTALSPAGYDVTGDRGAVIPLADTAGQSIYFVANEAGPAERQVYRIAGTGGPPERLTTRPGVHLPVLSPDGTRLALLHSDDLSPTELYLTDAKRRSSELRVTTSPPREFSTYQWAAPRYVSFKHKTDSLTIHARIIEPPNLDRSRKYPVIFGPVYSNTVRNHWNGLYGMVQQLLVQQGYIVVQVDVRGSTGYGRNFREKFLMDWGGGDLDDLESAADYLKTLPYADTDRMGIWGSSYGGTLTVFMLFKKPGLFKAGVAGAPATNPFFFGSDDVAIARRPKTNPEAFERGNALQYAKNLKDHLLIIHGMQDDVVPFKTSVVLAEELMKLGKDFDFAFAPAATHGWTQREYYARYLLGKLVGHFNRYLPPR